MLGNHNRLNQQIQRLAGLDANFVVTLQLFEGSFEMDAGSRMVALHVFSIAPGKLCGTDAEQIAKTCDRL